MAEATPLRTPAMASTSLGVARIPPQLPNELWHLVIEEVLTTELLENDHRTLNPDYVRSVLRLARVSRLFLRVTRHVITHQLFVVTPACARFHALWTFMVFPRGYVGQRPRLSTRQEAFIRQVRQERRSYRGRLRLLDDARQTLNAVEADVADPKAARRRRFRQHAERKMVNGYLAVKRWLLPLWRNKAVQVMWWAWSPTIFTRIAAQSLGLTIPWHVVAGVTFLALAYEALSRRPLEDKTMEDILLLAIFTLMGTLFAELVSQAQTFPGIHQTFPGLHQTFPQIPQTPLDRHITNRCGNMTLDKWWSVWMLRRGALQRMEACEYQATVEYFLRK